MPDQNEGRIGLDLEGPRITLDQLVHAAEALFEILRDVDSLTTNRAGGAYDWVVSDLRGGSAHLEVEPAAKDDRVALYASRQVIKNFQRGMALIHERAEKPPFFTDNALRRAKYLSSLAREAGVEAVTIRSNGSTVRLDRQVAEHVSSLVDGELRTIGSVEGTLEMVSLRGQRHCNVYDQVTGKPTRCIFPEALLEEVREALGKRVLVSGVFSVKRTGESTSLKVDRLEVFADEVDLPTVDSVRGILKHG